MSWIGRLVARAAAGVIAANRKQSIVSTKEVEGSEALRISKETIELEALFLTNIDRKIKLELHTSTAELMSHFLVGIDKDAIEVLDEKAARKVTGSIQKYLQFPAAVEEAIKVLGTYVPGDRTLLKTWIDELSADPPSLELALTNRYTAYMTTILPKWRSVYGYYYRQVIDNCTVKNKTIANTPILTQMGMLHLDPDLPIDSLKWVQECHLRLRGVVSFIDDYIGKKFIFGDKITIRFDFRPFKHVIPCIQALCDGLFKDVLGEQQHMTILNAYFKTIEAPQFSILQGIPPFLQINDIAGYQSPPGPITPVKPSVAEGTAAAIVDHLGPSLTAAPRPALRAAADPEMQLGAQPAQPRPWKPKCPACDTTLKFLPEYNVWFCSCCNDHYKI